MTDAISTGTPILVGPNSSQILERIPLFPKGQGAFDEAWLQRLIHNSPECLPVGEIEPGFGRLFPVCREMPIAAGFIDNLLMTGAGEIAIVETKLFRSPEARRQVVAQTLDYATSLFSMNYETFQKAALAGTFTSAGKPSSLHAAIPEAERLDEAAFSDAVSRNLRRGRALILIVGDGIRQEAESLVEGIQAHARFGFTLAMVELGVFGLPDRPETYLIRLRTLAKTAILHPTIVEITVAGTTVKEQPLGVPGGAATEGYWETLERNAPGIRAHLETFIKNAEPLGVYPEILGSLNLKWPRPNGKPVNLGYMTKAGKLWTDAAAWSPESDIAQGYAELAKQYVKDLALTFGCESRAMPTGKSWTVYRDGQALKLAGVLDRLDAWLGPMSRYIDALRAKDAQAEQD